MDNTQKQPIEYNQENYALMRTALEQKAPKSLLARFSLNLEKEHGAEALVSFLVRHKDKQALELTPQETRVLKDTAYDERIKALQSQEPTRRVFAAKGAAVVGGLAVLSGLAVGVSALSDQSETSRLHERAKGSKLDAKVALLDMAIEKNDAVKPKILVSLGLVGGGGALAFLAYSLMPDNDTAAQVEIALIKQGHPTSRQPVYERAVTDLCKELDGPLTEYAGILNGKGMTLG